MPSELSIALTDENWARAIKLARRDPKQTRVRSKRHGLFEGVTSSVVLPLHEALIGHAPLPVVQALLDASPESIYVKESGYNRLPLHCACRKNANIDIVRLLVDRDKDALLEPDSLGRLPLHYALSNGADEQIITLLLLRDPISAKGVDERGWTPLHVACNVGASMKVIQLMLHANREAIVMKTKKGSTPLDCLNKSYPHREEALALLVQARKDFDASFASPLSVTSSRSFEDFEIV